MRKYLARTDDFLWRLFLIIYPAAGKRERPIGIKNGIELRQRPETGDTQQHNLPLPIIIALFDTEDRAYLSGPPVILCPNQDVAIPVSDVDWPVNRPRDTDAGPITHQGWGSGVQAVWLTD